MKGMHSLTHTLAVIHILILILIHALTLTHTHALIQSFYLFTHSLITH